MFVDDIVICSESKEQVERSLERWRYALERRGMKVCRSKTEYMCMNERSDDKMVLLQGVEVPKVKEFRHLGSITTNILRPFFPLVGVNLLLPMTGPFISLHPLHHFLPNL